MARFILIKAKPLLALFWILSAGAGSVFGTEIPIGKKLTLGDVFALGFRPSNITPENLGILRCWEAQDIVLSFEGYQYSLKASDVTFRVFDDDQVESVEITGDRSHQFTLQESVEEARSLYGKFGPIPDDFERWLAGVKKAGMFSTYDRYVDTGRGYWFGLRLQPTLKRIDSTPAILSLMVKWEYQGKGPAGGLRLKPSTSPVGYDWDMSFQAWNQRVQEAAGKDPAKREPLAADAEKGSPQGAPQSYQTDSAKELQRPMKPHLLPGPPRLPWMLAGALTILLVGWLVSKAIRKNR